LFAVQTVSPVTEFDEHELTALGVAIAATVPPPSTGTIRMPVVGVVQDPFGTYEVTFPFWTNTDMEPLGAHDASTGGATPLICVVVEAETGP
jgi:hypothetical protein